MPKKDTAISMRKDVREKKAPAKGKASHTQKTGSTFAGKGRKTHSEIAGIRHELLSEPGDLPESYGETRVVLLPVNPYQVHVYWEIDDQTLEKTRRILARKYKQFQPALRFFDVTDIVFDGTNARGFFDVAVDLGAGNWYVHLWSPDKSYFADLGLITERGRFFPLGRSNVAQIPRDKPLPKGTGASIAKPATNAVPLPAGRRPERAAAEVWTAHPIREKSIKIEQPFKAQTFPASRVQAGQIAGSHRIAPVQPYLPKEFLARGELPPCYFEEIADLTDINERSFEPGISSEYASSNES